ncbi:hypothetical protein SB719_20320, partial [Pantoea sp. SIMBA_079]
DWVDYASMGISDATELYKVVRPVLEAVLIKQDIIDLALRSQVDTIAHPELVEHIVELRQALRDRLGKEDLDDLVVPFEPDEYNPQATIG